MTFEFGDVVLLPFPFTSHVAYKRRPAVIVSNALYASARPDVVVMAITSQLRPMPGFGEVWIQDWQTAGLLKRSAVKPVFATIEQALIVRALGRLGGVYRDALKEAVATVLG